MKQHNKRPYNDKSPFNSILYVYVRRENIDWLNEQLFQHQKKHGYNAKLSHYVDALLIEARRRKPLDFEDDDYTKECGVLRKTKRKSKHEARDGV